MLLTERWSVGLADELSTFGRAYVTLRAHKSSLSDLNLDDWHEFQAIVQRLEHVYIVVLGASLVNWSCLMNLAFRDPNPRPHVHWHLRPRWKEVPELDGIKYPDKMFGRHYDPTDKTFVDDAVVRSLAAKLAPLLAQDFTV